MFINQIVKCGLYSEYNEKPLKGEIKGVAGNFCVLDKSLCLRCQGWSGREQNYMQGN